MTDYTAPMVTAGVAAVSAITFVAYKHPDGYQRLLWLFRVVLVLSFVGLACWDIGSARTVTILSDFIEKSRWAEVTAKIADWKNFVAPAAITIGVAFVYLEFLQLLPMILAEKKPD
ncbi:hypothetical protein [Tardiphaga sp. 367_B4_N1_1]|uniref:hypothetical protein n=1 Tax=Tardiphaga sp. 367_B4_N1_1 TaxID=3240777 RepID=UPI003F29632B